VKRLEAMTELRPDSDAIIMTAWALTESATCHVIEAYESTFRGGRIGVLGPGFSDFLPAAITRA